MKVFLSTLFVYLFIVLFLRIIGKKELGQFSSVDLIFMLLISDVVEAPMLGQNPTPRDGFISAITLFLIIFLFKIFSYKSTKFSFIFLGSPTILIKEGKLQLDNLKRTKISYEDLNEAMREKNIKKIRDVQLSILERDGNISFLTREIPVKRKGLRRKYINGGRKNVR